jgi:diguanylate cyclase (GGDEF)-like protein/PAS domain S-box-containing protein
LIFEDAGFGANWDDAWTGTARDVIRIGRRLAALECWLVGSGGCMPVDDALVSGRIWRLLHDLVGRVNGCRTLPDTLQAVADGVVAVVGFDVAAVSYRHADGTFETVAVAGDDEARRQLLGARKDPTAYDGEFAMAESWGTLRFVPHERLPEGKAQGWVPDVDVLTGLDAWHPMDALFAPLSSSTGELVGMLSVDLPRDRRRPGAFQREMLEMFAAQAGIAIDNARLVEQLQVSEHAFRLAFEGAGTGMSVVSLSAADPGRFLRVNPALCAILGRQAQDVRTLRAVDITHPDDRDVDMDSMRAAMAGLQHVFQVEKRYLHASGADVWVSVTTSVVCDSDGTPLWAISQIEDISARRAASQELSRLASTDILTGLPNRYTFLRQVAEAVHRAETSGCSMSVLFCDVDRFKRVNDVHGHSAGDQALVAIAERLSRAARRGDIVARLGGDEFVVLAEHSALRDAEELAERLRRTVAQPIVIDGATLALSVSIGAATFPEDGVTADALLRTSDAAMYRVKQATGR